MASAIRDRWEELRAALMIPRASMIHHKRNDVHAEGLTLREVARSLRDAGAREVSEIALACRLYSGG
jgi:hypothetical protein